MPRRSYRRALPGQVYAVECLEWHVRCEEAVVIALMGECFTIQEAEKRLREGTSEEGDGWVCRDGLWYCPAHGEVTK